MKQESQTSITLKLSQKGKVLINFCDSNYNSNNMLCECLFLLTGITPQQTFVVT